MVDTQVSPTRALQTRLLYDSFDRRVIGTVRVGEGRDGTSDLPLQIGSRACNLLVNARYRDGGEQGVCPRMRAELHVRVTQSPDVRPGEQAPPGQLGVRRPPI